MSSAKAASEPSMEDILASIRQIIADEDAPTDTADQPNDQSAVDDAFANADESEVAVEDEMSTDDVDALFNDGAAGDVDLDFADADDDEDILELSSPSVDETKDMGGSDANSEEDEMALSFDDEQDDDEAPAAEINVPQEPAPQSPNLLTDGAVAASVKASLGALHGSMAVSSSSTIEGLVQEMLRPMLKEWLDENLPQTVERLVREEIQRIQGQ